MQLSTVAFMAVLTAVLITSAVLMHRGNGQSNHSQINIPLESLPMDGMSTQVVAIRAQVVAKIQVADDLEGSATGIVIAGGGSDIYAKAFFLVKYLRREFDCRLPIEIMYFDDGKLDPTFEKQLRSMGRAHGKTFMADLLSTAMGDRASALEEGVSIVELGEKFTGYNSQFKPAKTASLSRVFSIYKSSFEKVIYIDAVTTPLYDPALMLEWDSFRANGAVFWQSFDDVGAGHQTNKEVLWTTFGMEAPWKSDRKWKTVDPGQILIDRKRHADVIEWVLFVHLFNEATYKNSASDVWQLAFMLAGKQKQFKMVPYPPRAALGTKSEEVYDLLAIVQNSPFGQPVFARRVGSGAYNLSGADIPGVQWLSIGLPDAGVHAFAHHTDSASFGIHDQSTIYPHDVNCDCVDADTARQLMVRDSSRWQGCFSTLAALPRQLPVALLPLSWYPPELTAKFLILERAVVLLQMLIQTENVEIPEKVENPKTSSVSQQKLLKKPIRVVGEAGQEELPSRDPTASGLSVDQNWAFPYGNSKSSEKESPIFLSSTDAAFQATENPVIAEDGVVGGAKDESLGEQQAVLTSSRKDKETASSQTQSKGHDKQGRHTRVQLHKTHKRRSRRHEMEGFRTE